MTSLCDAKSASCLKAKSVAMDGSWLKPVHISAIVIGSIILALTANFDALWFDEAYSVAMAKHSFSDIWTIGSHDVHPVLYYWVLHCVYIVFGNSIYAFRLVSVIGIAVLSLLGYTHVRKEFGDRIGLYFSILVFLVPWSLHCAYQIRMYEWTIVVVFVVSIYGWRISRAIISRGKDEGDHGNASIWNWVALCIFSVVAAYLHYYGAIAAFCVQLFILAAIISHPEHRKSHLTFWFGQALLAVLCYAPWISVAASQASGVSGGFWIGFEYPQALTELLLFPFDPPELTDMGQKEVGPIDPKVMSGVLVVLFYALAIVFVVSLYLLGVRVQKDSQARKMSIFNNPVAYFLCIALGVMLLAGLASLLIAQPILYYRYLVVVIGPLLVIFSLALTSLGRSPAFFANLAIVVIFGVLTFSSILLNGHNPQNADALDAYGSLCTEVQEQNANDELLVFSDSWAAASIIAESDEGQPIVYMSPCEAYRAFEPRWIIDDSWRSLLVDYDQRVICVTTNDSAESFAEEFGGRIVETESFYHPYSNNWLTYTVIDF